MIKNFELLCLIFFVNNCCVHSQGFQSADAPKQQRTPQNTGCLNYGHSCLGAHGKRSRLIMPKFYSTQFMPTLDSSPQNAEESDLRSSEIGSYAPWRNLVRSNSHGYIPYLMPSMFFYKPYANSFPGHVDYNNAVDINGGPTMGNSENGSENMKEWARMLIENTDPNAFKELLRSTRQTNREDYGELQDKRIKVAKLLQQNKDSKAWLESIPREWLGADKLNAN